MIISHRHKFIFIKTRKVASSSLEKILDQYLGSEDISTGSLRDETPSRNRGASIHPHVDCHWIRDNFPTEWRSYFKFTVVRNPWDCLVSFYFFHRAIEPHKKLFSNDFNFFINNTRIDSWNDWPRYTENNLVMVDNVMRFEKLHLDLCNESKIPYQNELLDTFVKAQFRPQTYHYRHYYNSDTQAMVQQVFGPMIDHFQYRF